MTAPPAELSPRRRALLDAALQVLAEQGLRGLTHRAVDRQASLPEGSCSAYLRTRKALLTALTEYVAASLADDVDAIASELAGLPHDVDTARKVGSVAQMFLGWLAHPEMLLARQELTIEATRDPDLAAVLETARTGLVDVVDGILRTRGKDHGPERAEWLVASLDGILLAALLKPTADRAGFLARALEQTLSSLALE
ncbi:TetR/AcrR family transcriptional regulator [Nocardioides sp. W7]|uniref:TetR/AcrR family transcriptional regulator n=1 Tax=Nocardioides sp. W7 TaxID=2931390 RepID=UPI001FD52F47|nr:TetR/AcrR family transcriptional regulator [Nocardioides sp. W7]